MKIYVVTWEKDCYYGSLDERIGIVVVHSVHLDKATAEDWAKTVKGEVEEWEAK